MGKGSKRKPRKIGGCMWGLMNLFNFRRVQSGSKLITSSKSSSGRYRRAKEEKNEESPAGRSNDALEATRRRSRSCDMESDANSYEVKRSAKSVDFDDAANKDGETRFVLLSELKRILRKKPLSNEHFFAKSYLGPELKMEEDKFEKIYAEARKHIFDVLNSVEETPKQSLDGTMNKDEMLPFPQPSPVSVLDATVLEEKDSSPLVDIETSKAIGIAPMRIDFEDSEVEESIVERGTAPLAETEDLIAMGIAPLRVNLKKVDAVLEGEETRPLPSIDSLMAIEISVEEKEVHTVPDLVTYLLESADVNWEQLDLKPYCRDQAVDPAIMAKDFFGDMEYLEKKILVDCVNEVITEIWRRYTMKPMPEIRSTMREIRERVNWHRSRVPPPCSLDQLGKKDLSRPGLWMELQEDASLLAAETGESIFSDLIDELTLTM